MLDCRRCGRDHLRQDLASVSKTVDLSVAKHEHLIDLLKNVWTMRDDDHRCATSLEVLAAMGRGQVCVVSDYERHAGRTALHMAAFLKARQAR